MKNTFNHPIIKRIRELIPPNVNLAEYLINELSVSRQSAYRKIKGEIPFSFDQIAALSQKLGFSMDEIAGEENSSYSLFRLYKNAHTTPEETFVHMLEQYHKALIKRISNTDSGIVIIMNRIYFLSGFFFENLFRFYFYKWVHSTSDVPLDYRFADVTLSPEIVSLCKKINELLPRVSNNTYIVDPDAFYNSLTEIQYYHRRGLIDEKELSEIKDDLIVMIDNTEKLIRKGMYTETGTTFEYYISALPIESNGVYLYYNKSRESHLWVYPTNYLYSNDACACDMHQNWINSLKKYCTLTTLSNEKLQSDYFKNQREFLNKML